MKYTYTSLLSLWAVASMAQQTRTGFPAHNEDKHIGNVAAVRTMQAGHSKSLDYFTEEFTASLNGWTVVNALGNLDWTWTDVGPGPTTSTYPVPALATSTGGWAIIDDDLLGQNGVETDTWLISPVIDLSAAPQFLKLEFEQYFQEFAADTTYVGITVDGGTTWNQVAINDGVGRDGRPNPELVDLNISDWVALGASTVQIGFRYSSIWDYGWQVDNVHITDLEANDIALLNTHYTNFDFENTGFSEIEYSIYPQQQVRLMQPKADVKNKGYATQTDVTFNVDVTGPGGAEYSGPTSLGDLTPAQSAPVLDGGFTPSGAIGQYTVEFNASQTEVDDDPSDNDYTMTFQVSSDVFAHDDGTVQQYQVQGLDNVGDQFEVGNYYEAIEEQDLLSIRVALHNNTAVGALIYGAIYDDQNPPALIDQTEDYEVTAADVNALGGSTFIELPFSTPVTLAAGQVALVMAGSYGGAEQVAFATSGTSAAQVSIINYPTTGDIFFVTKTPMVRAVMENSTGVQEVNAFSADATVQPNPMQESARLTFTLASRADVTVELRDMTGRLIASNNLGKLNIGVQQHAIDGSSLAAGSYTWTLIVGGQRRTVLMVKN